MMDWYTYLHQLGRYISSQSSKINQMEQTIIQLQQQLDQLKKSPTTNVERIEYKFDQLKIERLEGTLNIGLNPSDLNSVGEFSVQQGSMQTPGKFDPKHEQITKQIGDQVNRFLEEECPELIRNLEDQHNRNLGESFHRYIIEDVRKQIYHRITYYLNQYESQINSDEKEKYQDLIIQKVKEDIEKSLIAFINNMPNDIKGGVFNEFHGD